ncbi:MAG TPA: non-ribosomal peptide synthetase, partial [Longimicrobium sp.]|nr:non-ribosomal peptide synthetase [Longimicrobium sp.]
DARANRIAGLLREMGVGPETRVALCLERGPDQAACALAVVKAGGAFVPLDPAHPRDRRAWLMADSGASLLVATRDLADGLPEAPRVLVLDEAEDRIAAASPASPEVEVPLEAAAYVVYTSGSTGTPKGVLVPHRGIGAMHGFADAMDVGPGSRLLQFYSFSFDMFVMETTVGLTRGACLVMGNPERMRPGPDLVALMRSERVTQSLISPAVLAVMPEGELPDLHTIISGGEALPPETVTRWGAGRRLLNGYGPTECTMGATVSGPVDGERRPPIGRAIPGYTTWVLDPEMRPSPVGAPGELYLGGVGVARGYLGRPGLTAERFVPDPYGGEPGARLYRSGDRVAWRGDGQLDFLGRVDEQVKIRGHRIEPREVEAVLRAHPDVHAAAVIAREDRGEKRLVGYVVAREGADPSPGALREHVAARLPNAMVPSAVVRIERIPLNTHGKLDVRALPAPDLSDSGTEHVPPRTPTEQALAALWAELLGVPRVGAEDSFFDLGGHSLLATRLVSALRLKLDVELPLRDVFDAPRLSQLADRIDVVQAESLAALGAELEGLSEDELRTLLDETAAAAAPAEQG